MAQASNVSSELMAEAIETVATLKREARQAAGKIGPAVKKFEELGVNKKALMRVVKDRLRDDEEVKAENRAYIQMMTIEGQLVSEEDLFGGLDLAPLGGKSAQQHLVWSAEEAGYRAGFEGADDDSAKRYPAGSPAQAAWARGHRRGTAARAEIQPEGVEVADQRKTRGKKEEAPPPPANDTAPPPVFVDPVSGKELHDDGNLFDDDPPATAPAKVAKKPSAPKVTAAPEAQPKAAKRGPGRPPKVAAATGGRLN